MVVQIGVAEPTDVLASVVPRDTAPGGVGLFLYTKMKQLCVAAIDVYDVIRAPCVGCK